MPTYEYRCTNKQCKYNKLPFEVNCSIKHVKLSEKCPVCGADSERYFFTPIPFHFHSRGFYTTDHKKKSRGDNFIDNKVEDLF